MVDGRRIFNAHPHARMQVLIDGQVYIDGVGAMSSFPKPIASLGIQVRGACALWCRGRGFRFVWIGLCELVICMRWVGVSGLDKALMYMRTFRPVLTPSRHPQPHTFAHTPQKKKVLKSKPLRSYAGKLSYHDPETFSTLDAMRIGRVHCLRPGT